MKEEYEIKFWKDWLEADSIKRRELIEKLSIVRDIENINKMQKIPKKIRKHFFVSLLNSFFEDLENVIYTKIRLETKKKKKK
jgi:hypothetical protein